MESEILKTVQEIRAILFVLSAFISIAILIWFLRTILQVFNYLRDATKQAWYNKAEKFYQKAQYKQLHNHCNLKLNEYPNDVYAILWLAKSLQAQKKSSEALELFHKLIRLEPSWREEYIEPYLKEIEKQLNGQDSC